MNLSTVFNQTLYTKKLLQQVGFAEKYKDSKKDYDAPALAWKRCGLSQFSPDPIGFSVMANGALEALRLLSPQYPLPPTGIELLGERARLLALSSQDSLISANGTCFLLPSQDGMIALSLAREDDWMLLSAWLDGKVIDNIEQLKIVLCQHKTIPLIEKGRLLGLAVSSIQKPETTSSWYNFTSPPSHTVSPKKHPLVLDLSSLWAGPLISNLLTYMGAEVIKLESITRPDGARNNEKDKENKFYQILNGNKESITLDLSCKKGQKILHKLIKHADIVIEGSRPRALEQMGINAQQEVEEHSGKLWASLTAYGRDDKTKHYIGFGDDIAVHSGLTSCLQELHGKLGFVGDAIADPLTGLHGTLAVWAHYLKGGGLLDLPLSQTMSYVLQHRHVYPPHKTPAPFYPIRPAFGKAHTLGADTDRILKRFHLC